MNKPTNQNKDKLIEADNRLMITRGVGGLVKDKIEHRGQLNGDRWKLDFW